MKKILLNIAGILCLALGLIGIIVPVLPTTPFLLLASASFAASSKKLHAMLLKNKILSAYIENYKNKCGVPLPIKIFSLSFLWASLIISAIFVKIWYVWLILAAVGIAVTLHILLLKTKKPPNKNN